MDPRKKRGRTAFDPIDVHVGKRVRIRRKLLGMSQSALGDILGISYQQLQKSESGANRFGASRLFGISQALDVPVSFFFEDMPEEIAGRRDVGAGPAEPDILSADDATVVLRAYYAIKDRTVRSALSNMLKEMARKESPQKAEDTPDIALVG